MKTNGLLENSVAGLAEAGPGSATPATGFLRPPTGPVLRVWRPNIRSVLAAMTLLAGLIPLRGADNTDAEIQALREQIRLLDQRLDQLQQQQQQLKDQQAAAAAESAADQAAAAKTAANVSITDKGFTLSSGDGANSVKIRGLVQLDSRLFFGDQGASTNAYVLRRARLISEGTFSKLYSFQFVTDFAGTGAPSILDANLGVALDQTLQLKFGKFKSPVGLEWLQSDSWTFFDERSIVTDLVPNRDLGILASGSLLGDTISYAAGVLNGVPDGATSNNTAFDNDKNVVGRIYATPFKSSGIPSLQGLSIGVSADLGREKTTSGRTAGYKTDGQQTFFSYNAAVIADGQSWHVSPQGEYRYGPFGLLGEYVLSTVNVRPGAGAAKAELRNKAWQLAAGYVLTGEDSSFNGVTPRTIFNPTAGTWGAFEIVGRYANLKIDDAAFPRFASASSNADEATSLGLGLNWYLSKVVAVKFDFYQTRFGFAPGAPAVPTAVLLRQHEKALITRFQVSF
jgi:phosphate-selective porin OprO/OprP